MKRLALVLLLTTCAGLLMPGCEKKPAIAPVQGTVKINGVVAGGIDVQFYPDHKKDTRGPRSSGVTDENGAFTLKTDTGEEGAVVGFHRVVLDDTRRRVAQQGEMPSPDDSRIPEHYTQLAYTPVLIEVKPGQPIVIEVTRP
jgi:hypothetical protein